MVSARVTAVELDIGTVVETAGETDVGAILTALDTDIAAVQTTVGTVVPQGGDSTVAAILAALDARVTALEGA